MSELKSCPFCGNKATVRKYDTDYYVICTLCGVERLSSSKNKRDAIKEWNRRPIEDEQNIRITELEHERGKLRAVLQGLINALEGYFGKTSDDFFDGADCDSGELYFAAEYNAARAALKGDKS